MRSSKPSSSKHEAASTSNGVAESYYQATTATPKMTRSRSIGDQLEEVVIVEAALQQSRPTSQEPAVEPSLSTAQIPSPENTAVVNNETPFLLPKALHPTSSFEEIATDILLARMEEERAKLQPEAKNGIQEIKGFKNFTAKSGKQMSATYILYLIHQHKYDIGVNLNRLSFTDVARYVKTNQIRENPELIRFFRKQELRAIAINSRKKSQKLNGNVLPGTSAPKEASVSPKNIAPGQCRTTAEVSQRVKTRHDREQSSDRRKPNKDVENSGKAPPKVSSSDRHVARPAAHVRVPNQQEPENKRKTLPAKRPITATSLGKSGSNGSGAHHSSVKKPKMDATESGFANKKSDSVPPHRRTPTRVQTQNGLNGNKPSASSKAAPANVEKDHAQKRKNEIPRKIIADLEENPRKEAPGLRAEFMVTSNKRHSSALENKKPESSRDLLKIIPKDYKEYRQCRSGTQPHSQRAVVQTPTSKSPARAQIDKADVTIHPKNQRQDLWQQQKQQKPARASDKATYLANKQKEEVHRRRTALNCWQFASDTTVAAVRPAIRSLQGYKIPKLKPKNLEDQQQIVSPNDKVLPAIGPVLEKRQEQGPKLPEPTTIGDDSYVTAEKVAEPEASEVLSSTQEQGQASAFAMADIENAASDQSIIPEVLQEEVVDNTQDNEYAPTPPEYIAISEDSENEVEELIDIRWKKQHEENGAGANGPDHDFALGEAIEMIARTLERPISAIVKENFLFWDEDQARQTQAYSVSDTHGIFYISFNSENGQIRRVDDESCLKEILNMKNTAYNRNSEDLDCFRETETNNDTTDPSYPDALTFCSELTTGEEAYMDFGNTSIVQGGEENEFDFDSENVSTLIYIDPKCLAALNPRSMYPSTPMHVFDDTENFELQNRNENTNTMAAAIEVEESMLDAVDADNLEGSCGMVQANSGKDLTGHVYANDTNSDSDIEILAEYSDGEIISEEEEDEHESDDEIEDLPHLQVSPGNNSNAKSGHRHTSNSSRGAAAVNRNNHKKQQPEEDIQVINLCDSDELEIEEDAITLSATTPIPASHADGPPQLFQEEMHEGERASTPEAMMPMLEIQVPIQKQSNETTFTNSEFIATTLGLFPPAERHQHSVTSPDKDKRLTLFFAIKKNQPISPEQKQRDIWKPFVDPNPPEKYGPEYNIPFKKRRLVRLASLDSEDTMTDASS